MGLLRRGILDGRGLATIPLGLRRGWLGEGFALERQIPKEFARWALAMRMIKCLKGNWWMPWHAQAMKDVIRCDKLGGGANTL